MIGKRLGAAFAAVAVAIGLVAATPATAAPAKPADQPSLSQLKGTYHLGAKVPVVIDSNLTYDQAIGDSVVPPQYAELHAKMKPYLRVVPVLYWGYENNPKVHLGQIVVHKDLVQKTTQLFAGMFWLGFPIKSVIPQSQFGYSDAASMAVNNSSNYRPEILGSGNPSEHARAIAYDINPFTNPFMVSEDGGVTWFIDPPGAFYDPAAKGAIVKDSPVHVLWRSAPYYFEWGGGWGDINAHPPTDFYMVNFYDYQHMQPNFRWYCTIDLPPGLETCPANSKAVPEKPTKVGYDLAA